jgi:leucyl-tRNA synthetase
MTDMAFQELLKENGKFESILKVKGRDILGIPLSAPLSFYPCIYTLPMLSILETKVSTRWLMK